MLLLAILVKIWKFLDCVRNKGEVKETEETHDEHLWQSLFV